MVLPKILVLTASVGAAHRDERAEAQAAPQRAVASRPDQHPRVQRPQNEADGEGGEAGALRNGKWDQY